MVRFVTLARETAKRPRNGRERARWLPPLAIKPLPGAKVVKAFNHLPAQTLAEDASVKGGRRVIFMSTDDESVTPEAERLVETLGFAPIMLGRLAEGGLLVAPHGNSWGALDFQDFVKFG